MARPREFDEKSVLDAAAQCFLAKGYGSTSTRDLCDRMAMTPASLYNAFGDKRRLFLKTLDHYLDLTLIERITRLEKSPSPAQAITGYFSEIVERSLIDPFHCGCMLVNSALESTPEDAEMRAMIVGKLSVLEGFFRRCFAAAQAAREVPADPAAERAAQMLLASVLGLRVLARVNPQRPLLEGAAAQTLSALGLPRLTLP